MNNELFEEFEGLMHALNDIYFKADQGIELSIEEVNLVKSILNKED